MIIDIYCQKCNAYLYRYYKDIPGKLIKCYRERILKDFTENPMTCPKCGQVFAREAMIHGKPAYKIIQGKVFVKK